MQIALIGIHVPRGGIHLDLAGAKDVLQRRGDGASDFFLYQENVVQIALIGLRPQVGIAAGFNQLRGDTHLIALLAYRTLQHMMHSQ